MAELLAPTVARKPDVPALVDEFGETSWRGFDERTNRLLSALRERGLAPGQTIAVMSGNRRELLEVTVAVAHGSWIVVPINWHWVAEELAYVLEDSGAKALVVDDRFADVALEARADPATDGVDQWIVIGGARDGLEAYEAVLASGNPDEPPDQGMGGPMFYTSGTTGFPKGVRSTLTQVGLPLEVLGMITTMFCDLLSLPSDGVTLLDGPAYHSAQWVFSVFPLIGGGSTLVMRHKFDPTEMLELIDRYRVTNVHLVPTQFVRLLKLPDDVRGGFDGSSLVTVMHGAAPCPPEVKRSMIDWWGPVITEYYGGTEGGFLTMISSEEWLEHPGSLGRAMDNVELMIVRDDDTLAGPGEAGQIYFRNKLGTDFEYHNDPDKTTAAHREPGVGTLGDIGYLDDDGYLYMSDRRIDMIISGGVNIYPAEIEHVLVGHPAVADAAVFGIPEAEMGEQVKAAVELVDGYEPSDELAGDLMGHCREHLAGYKLPRSIDFVARLPRHPTGKLYKRLLRDPYWEGTGRVI
ncbi:MAG: Long-chain-fatty-acid--CoA ligase FadD13 [Acidimicrobiales bacterium]|nr:Long-chain-fatty-acid--CoA ligase FadD13 [Acidimicrobiales bacterium]